MTTLTAKQLHWSEIVNGWSASGLSQVEYCQKNAINLKSFYSWKYTLDAKKKDPRAQGKFLDVTPNSDHTGNTPISIVIQGMEIRYCRDTDKTLFIELVNLLRGGGMIRPSNSSLKVYLYCEPVDMRKQADGLSAIVEQEMQLKVFSKSLFVFINKRKDKLKILCWEKNGFVVWYKRLEKERFCWFKSTDCEWLSKSAYIWRIVQSLPFPSIFHDAAPQATKQARLAI